MIKTKITRGGVLLLALILAVNILMPASAWAAVADPGYIYITIDGTLYSLSKDSTWENAINNRNAPNQLVFTFDDAGHVIVDGKYVTSDGSTPVLKTDTVNGSYFASSPGVYYTMAIPLDFTAPESLSMRATQGSSDLTIDPCVITNTGTEDLKLSQVEISAATGWTVVNTSTDFTAADSKNKIAFKTGTHDFSSGSYSPGETIAAGGNATVLLEGKISEKADLTSATQVASMVVTVEKAVPALISFNIGSISYQAEEGMTWSEWCNSSYNVADVPYSVDEENGIVGHIGIKNWWWSICDDNSKVVNPADIIIADYAYGEIN